MSTQPGFAIGIDLGGTKILAGLVSESAMVGEPLKLDTPSGANNIIDTLVEAVSALDGSHPGLLGVGIATAGIVDSTSGAVIGSTGNLPGWEGTKVKHILEERTGFRTQVENDANAAAYGEYSAGGFHGKKCLLMVTLGTGIGGGIIIDGKLYRGANFAGGEVGHIKISTERSRRCTCGLWDCWESYGSGRGLVETAKRLLSRSSRSLLSLQDEDLTSHKVVEAARAKDQVGEAALSLYHEHVAIGLSGLCHTLDPDTIVVSGGMSAVVDFELLHDLLASMTLPRISERLEIHRARLGESAGMVGAAQLVIDAQTKIESMSIAG